MNPTRTHLLTLAILATAGAVLAISISTEAGFVAVGSNIIRTSEDGINWNPQTVPGTAFLKAVEYENGVYIATGNSGVILRATSPSSWNLQASNVTTTLWGVASDGSEWKAIGGGSPNTFGTILTSSNGGVSWTPQTNPSPGPLVSISSAPMGWVIGSFQNAPSPSSTAAFRYSATGATWSTHTATPFTQYGYGVLDIATNGTTWIGVNGGSTSHLLSSTNGVTWTWYTAPSTFAYSIHYADNQWIYGGMNRWIYKSTTGLAGSWTGMQLPGTSTDDVRDITYDGCRWLAVTNSALYTSTDAVTWNTGQTGGATYEDVTATPCLTTCYGPTSVVAGTSATFTLVGANPPYSWSAPGASTTTGSGSTFTTSWSTSGSHDVNLTDSASTPYTSTCTVNVVDALTCTTPATSIVAGSSITYNRTGGQTPYFWNAPGSNNATGSGTSITRYYNATGTYTANVTNPSPAQVGTCLSVTVVNQLTCSANPTTTIAGTPVTLTPSGPPETHTWTNTGGNPPTGNGALSVTYPAGNHTATVTSTSPSQTATCSIQAIPGLACSATPATFVRGTPTNVTATGGTPPYAWSTATSSGTTNPWPTSFATAGTHDITVTDSGTGTLQQTKTCTVTVTDPPLSCSPASQTIKQGATATLNATGGSGTYAWSSPSGEPTTGNQAWFNSTFIFPGWFVAQVTSGTQSVACSIEVPLPLPPPPQPGLPYPEATRTGQVERTYAPPRPHLVALHAACGDYDVTLQAAGSSDTDGRVVSHAWLLGQVSHTGPILQTRYPGPGLYSVRLTVMDDSGLTSTLGLDLHLRACLPLEAASQKATTIVGTPVKVCLQPQGGTGTYRYSAHGLPAEAVLEAGCLKWTPMTPGETCFPIQIQDDSQLREASLCVEAVAPAIPEPKEETPGAPPETASRPTILTVEPVEPEQPLRVVSPDGFSWLAIAALGGVAALGLLTGILVAGRRRKDE